MDPKDRAGWSHTLWEPLDKLQQNPLYQKKEEVRVAAYCRVSSGHTNFISLENQVTYYSNYIYSQPNWKLIGIYTDDRISGATIKNRPGIKRLLRHAKEGRIDLILTKSISRFSRNTKEILEVIDEFKKTNTTIIFENERLEVVNGERSLMLETHAAMAQEFIESLSSLVKFSYKKNLKDGRPYFGNIYGYDPITENTKHMVKINEREAEIVRWIFSEFINGVTYAEISRQLNLAGIKTKKGSTKWTGASVRNLLRKIEYTGNKLTMKRSKDMLTGKVKDDDPNQQQYLIENSHPSIISFEVFEKAQERIEQISFKHESFPEPVKNSLSARVVCGRCGSNIIKMGKYRFICTRSKPDVNLCGIEKLYTFDPQRMILKALFERLMDLEIDVNKDRKGIHYEIQFNKFRSREVIEVEFKKMKEKLEQIIVAANKNEHFEFVRLRYFNQLEIAKIQGGQEEHQRIKDEYDAFDKKANEVEEDRELRIKALEWLKSIRNLDSFIMKSSIEILRAWAFQLEVYSRTVYKVRWIDEKTTIIGEGEIPEIMKVVEKRKEERERNFNLHQKSIDENIKYLNSEYTPDENLTESKKKIIAFRINNGREGPPVEVSQRISDNMNYIKTADIIKADVTKLENGLNIKDLDNLKQNIIKARYEQIKENKKLRVAAYCRVSTHMEEQKTSLQTQLAFYNYKIISTPNWELAGIYVDEGLSGTSTDNRDSFNRMINDARRGKIDMIITKSVSRFSRNVLDVLETVKLLNELEPPVPVYFEKEKIYSDDKSAGMLLSLMAASAQDQVLALANNISWGLQNLAKRGIITRRTDMYGYTIDEDRSWYIVEDEAKVVREIFQLYMGGSEISDIILFLNRKGIKSPKGIDYWDPNTIRAMLRNEKYIGDYEYQRKYTVDTMTGKRRMNRGQVPKYYIEGHHIPIIEKHIYESVQKLIKENRREPVPDARKAGTAGRESYYQKFYCGECGAVMSRYGSSIYDSREGSKWRCNHSYRVVTSNCSAKTFMEKYMDYNFVKTLEEIKRSKKFRVLIRKSLSNLELTPSELEDKEMIEEQIEKLNQQLYNAVDMEVQKNGKDTNLINDITDKIIKLREKQLAYIERIEKLDEEQERFRNLMKYCEKIDSISFRTFHNMRPRIQQGESLYLTSNAIKNSTYMDLDGVDHFPEEVFAEYVLSGSINLEGRIKFKFAEDIEFGIDMTYEDYQQLFEEEKLKIQWEEFIHSEEVTKLKEFCKVPRKPIEIKEHLGISSNTSFYKRIKNPLQKAGLIELIDSKYNRNRKYKWVDGSDDI